MRGRGLNLPPAVAYFIGAVLIVISLGVYKKHSSFVASAAHARGEVIELKASRSSGRRHRTSYHPVVRFKDERGQEHTFTGSVGSNPSPWDVGDSVDVVYPPAAPDAAELNDFTSQSLLPVFLGAFGLVFIGAGWFRARQLQP